MAIHTCDGPGGRAGPGILRDRSGRQSRVIDMHAHMSLPAAAELARPFLDPALDANSRYTSPEARKVNHDQMATLGPRLATVEAKIADMDRMGVDMQVLSPAPTQYYYWAEPELGAETSRMINDAIADEVAARPDRFAGFATLPMQAPELALREMRRAARDLGLRGIEISSNVGGVELSDPRFAPVFAAAEELGLVIFLHPLGFSHGERMTRHYLNNVIGNPLESTLAISHLIFGGVLDDHPGLKICVAHGGGYLPTYSGRMDHAYRARPDCRGCKDLPSNYLRKMYFDTVIFDPDQLAYLVKTFGADHVVMGTDYPFDMGEADPAGFVRGASGLSPAQIDAVLGGTAAALLGLEATAAPA